MVAGALFVSKPSLFERYDLDQGISYNIDYEAKIIEKLYTTDNNSNSFMNKPCQGPPEW